MTKRERLPWLDSLKGFGIFCVTLGHLRVSLPLETHIYSFHMFLFFFLSGYLFKKKPLAEWIQKKIASLLIPFLIWDFLSSVAGILAGDDIRETIRCFFVLDGEYCWNAPIWFLMILFLTEILYDAIMQLSDSTAAKAAVAVGSGVLWVLIGTINLPLKVNLIPLAMMFYSLGNLYRGWEPNMEAISGTRLAAVLFGLGILSILFGTLLNISISYTEREFGNIYHCMIGGIAGTLFYTLLFQHCNFLAENRILRILGQNSMIIMITQYWLFTVYDYFSLKWFGFRVWREVSTPKALLVTCITLYLIVGSVSLLKRRFSGSKCWKYARYFGIQQIRQKDKIG